MLLTPKHPSTSDKFIHVFQTEKYFQIEMIITQQFTQNIYKVIYISIMSIFLLIFE